MIVWIAQNGTKNTSKEKQINLRVAWEYPRMSHVSAMIFLVRFLCIKTRTLWLDKVKGKNKNRKKQWLNWPAQRKWPFVQRQKLLSPRPLRLRCWGRWKGSQTTEGVFLDPACWLPRAEVHPHQPENELDSVTGVQQNAGEAFLFWMIPLLTKRNQPD